MAAISKSVKPYTSRKTLLLLAAVTGVVSALVVAISLLIHGASETFDKQLQRFHATPVVFYQQQNNSSLAPIPVDNDNSAKVSTSDQETKPLQPNRTVSVAAGNANAEQVCERRTPGKPACYLRDLMLFEIASVHLAPKRVTCSDTAIKIDFTQLSVARMQTSGGSGITKIQVEYSDGKSDYIDVSFPRSGIVIQKVDGPSHTFDVGPGEKPKDLAYRVNVLTHAVDATASQPWRGATQFIESYLDSYPATLCYKSNNL